MPNTKTRVNKVATVIIPVKDQAAMIAFYTEKLGFEMRVDVPMGDVYRWVEVGVGDEATTIALAPPADGGQTGNRETGISLQTGDIDGYYELLKTGGVDVDDQIARMGDPVPPMFWFRDLEGNSLMVVQ